MSFIAVDIGGTQLRAASYPTQSTQHIKQARTTTHEAGDTVYKRVVKLIENVWPDEQVETIGLASPGPLDPNKGIILETPNIKEWKEFPLGPQLAEQFHVPVHIDNDGNLAGLAEWRYGAGKGFHNVLYLTISTGIGGGIILNDQLVQGEGGLAGELGHMLLDPDGPLCGCGHAGHVEAYVSGPSITRYIVEKLKAGEESELKPEPPPSPREVANAARRGDVLACNAFKRAGEYLGMAVANYLAIINPGILIFGGGVTQAGELLFTPFRVSLQQRILHPRYLAGLVITQAALGDEAGLLGALALAKLKSK